MRISVIIPVYNAAEYLAESVRSALAQPETAEVIIVDDGSKDHSLEIAYELQKEDKRIKVFTHEGALNWGSAETRNLAIKAAQFEYVAFIDADDIFLPGRFALTQKIFEQHPDAEGVYEAVKNAHTYTAISYSSTVSLDTVPESHIVQREVLPENLLQLLIDDPVGIIMLQGLCVKRNLFKKSGLFDPAFRVFEDMLLIKKMAAIGRLYPGSLSQPVSERRIHDSNLSFSEYKDTNPTQFMEAEALLRWSINKHLPKDKMNAILRFNYHQFVYRNNASFATQNIRFKWGWSVIKIFPGVLSYNEFWKAIPVIGRFIN